MPSKICEHGKQKYRCKDCGGSAICEHRKIKYRCKHCWSSAFCEHGRQKDKCRDCCSSAFCEHNRLKYRCRDCGGSAYCIHNKWKSHCKECNGSGICIHGKLKCRCKDCGGSAFCEHGKLKVYCKSCGGSAFCEHGKWKIHCKDCGGSSLCKAQYCDTIASKKEYAGYCLRCFVHLFPDKPNARNYKTKERAVVEFLQTTFPHLTLVADKKVEDGCSRRRPDVLIDFGEQVLCVEIDENMHTGYDCSCETKRLMEISRDIGHRPLVFLRFNPDSYLDEKGATIRSPWGLNGSGLSVVKRVKEWEHRLTVLQEQVKYWSENRTEKTVEVVELFYDRNVADEKNEETRDEDVDDGTARGGAGV